MSDTDSMSVPEGEVLKAARKKVMEINELLELILTFLPAKRIFSILTVSKYWNRVIVNSAQLQQKMFLRLRNKPYEFWTVDAKHKPGANRFPDAEHLNDTELKFRRVESFPNIEMPAAKPSTLNPMLRDNSSYSDRNALDVYLPDKCGWWGNLRYSGWINPHQHDESLWETYLTDPPCYEAEVVIFNFFFGDYDVGTGIWTPPNVPADHEEDAHKAWDDPGTKAEIFFHRGDTLVKPDEPLTIGDVLKPAFETRHEAYCRSPLIPVLDHYIDDATMHEVFDGLKARLGAKSLPKRVYMKLYMRVHSSQGQPKIILPTDEQRAQANAEWKPRKRV